MPGCGISESLRRLSTRGYQNWTCVPLIHDVAGRRHEISRMQVRFWVDKFLELSLIPHRRELTYSQLNELSFFFEKIDELYTFTGKLQPCEHEPLCGRIPESSCESADASNWRSGETNLDLTN